MSHVVKGDDCWRWGACTDKYGRGRFNFNGASTPAPVVSYIIHKGEFDRAALRVLHTCDNPNCVNPRHLWLGTQPENIQDCVSKNRNQKGEKNGRRVLSEVQVREILAIPGDDPRSNREIGGLYGVGVTCIRFIRQRKTWRHVNV